jgi:hypothetical protein
MAEQQKNEKNANKQKPSIGQAANAAARQAGLPATFGLAASSSFGPSSARSLIIPTLGNWSSTLGRPSSPS